MDATKLNIINTMYNEMIAIIMLNEKRLKKIPL